MRDHGDENRFERVERSHDFEWHDHRAWDRIAFAQRVLDLLEPKNLSVVLYRGVREMRVERRRLRPGSRTECATVSIPPHATPERIVVALAELVGVADVPFLVDLILARAHHPYR